MNPKTTLALLCGLLIGTATARAENIVLPADAGALNVRDLGVKGDGTTDDTAALQAAITKYHSHPNGTGFHCLYFPNGTYLVSDQLTWGTDKYNVGPWLQGQSRDGVVIKLRDNAPGYSDEKARKSVIYTGDGGADNFGNMVKNLTINTGKGNAQAVGIRYNSNNWGTLGEVKIVSGDGAGYAGVDLEYTDQIGPCLLENIEVEGFDFGALVAYGINSSTWRNITLRNPRVAGLRVRENVVNMENLTIVGAPLAVSNRNGWLTLVGANFSGGKGGTAVSNAGQFYTRDLVTAGYAKAIESQGDKSVAGPKVAEFVAGEKLNLYPTEALQAPVKSLGLPVKPVPAAAYEWDDDLSHWVNPMKFGAAPGDDKDDTEAIQKAIDTPGATTLYFPKTGFEQKYIVNGTLHIRGDIARVVDFDIVNIQGEGVISVEDGSAPVVVIDRVGTAFNTKLSIEHNASRAVVLSSLAIFQITANGTGDLFIKDATALARFNNPRGRIWARQLNPESPVAPCIINDGATFWVLGTKIEYGATALVTKNGGQSEMLGLHYYDVNKIDPTREMFIIDNARVSLVNIRETQFNGPENFNFAVRETQKGQTRVLSKGDIKSGGIGGFGLPLYLSYDGKSEVGAMATQTPPG